MNTAPAARATTARRLGSVLVWAVVIAFLVLIWPSSLGGCTTLTVISGQSIQPTLQPGDFAVLRCADPSVGDVIAYRPFPDEPALVIHRIIGGDGDTGWRLQGDNNNFVDPFLPVAAQVRGALLFSVPRVGAVLSALGQPWVWGSMFLIAGGLLWLSVLKRDEESVEPSKHEEAEPQAESASEEGAAAGSPEERTDDGARVPDLIEV